MKKLTPEYYRNWIKDTLMRCFMRVLLQGKTSEYIAELGVMVDCYPVGENLIRIDVKTDSKKKIDLAQKLVPYEDKV